MNNQTSNTEDLIQLLRHGALDEVIYRGGQQPTFPAFLAQLCAERETTREQVIQHAGIERSYGHQLFNGIRRPSRDKALQLAFGFSLDAEQTQALLRSAEVGQLTPRAKRDAVILYCLMHQLSLGDTQNLLSHFSLRPLGGERA
jgi:transcriptional regulator with XRE-family HTH domain